MTSWVVLPVVEIVEEVEIEIINAQHINLLTLYLFRLLTVVRETAIIRFSIIFLKYKERQQIFNWDKYEYKSQRNSLNIARKRQDVFRNIATLKIIPNSEKLYFNYNARPKPIIGSQQPIGHYPTQAVLKYEKEKASMKNVVQKSRPKVFRCPQISLDDVPEDRREIVCKFMYSTTKTMNELTSGVPECRNPEVDIPLSPYGDPGKLKARPVHEPMLPLKNYRRVSFEWDAQQSRIFGGWNIK
ncbi:uncharacterized protein LOC126896575 [Daktulosphaira vitifoliae]|uniref:uncharacterized protein LOC126896575 n=1 Tax=Daktulosphaira vitifoliae TaxID=58002 RepID=UPI0021A9A252|nr:uncharacterized protein LOC126896575 [Daktulosphaira vitifoliae]